MSAIVTAVPQRSPAGATPVCLTLFRSGEHTKGTPCTIALAELSYLLEVEFGPRHPEHRYADEAQKRRQPLIKPAQFAGHTRAEGSHIIEHYGLALDIDKPTIDMQDAARRLRAAGYAAFLYETWKANGRYRVVVPFSAPLPGDADLEHAARPLAALIPCIGAESFDASRCYFIGRPKGEERAHLLVEGEPFTAEYEPSSDVERTGKDRNARVSDPSLYGEALQWARALLPAGRIVKDRLRISSSALGRALEEDLTIAADGTARDFGTGKGFATPLDVVRAFVAPDGGLNPRLPGHDGRYLDDGGEALPADYFRSGCTEAQARELLIGAGWADAITRFALAVEQAHRDGLVAGEAQADRHESGITLPAAVPLGHLAHTEPPAPSFKIADWLPEGAVTLFAGHGESGKSYIALSIAIALALGHDVFGRTVTRSRVVYYCAEDPAAVVQWRVRRICQHHGWNAADLDGWLVVLDMSDRDPTLYSENANAAKRLTPTYTALAEYFETSAADVLITDNAADAFDGNENDRAKVRQFVNALKRITTARSGAVLLLAHVNKATAQGQDTTERYSGSTGWHNSVRARWSLSGVDIDDPGAGSMLALAKSNWGAKGLTVPVHWSDAGKCFVLGETVLPINASEVSLEVLRAFADIEAKGLWVSMSPRASNSPKAMLTEYLPRGVRAGSLGPALQRLREKGLIEMGTAQRANRTSKGSPCWQLTDTGRAACSRLLPVAPGCSRSGHDREQAEARTSASAPGRGFLKGEREQIGQRHNKRGASVARVAPGRAPGRGFGGPTGSVKKGGGRRG